MNTTGTPAYHEGNPYADYTPVFFGPLAAAYGYRTRRQLARAMHCSATLLCHTRAGAGGRPRGAESVLAAQS